MRFAPIADVHEFAGGALSDVELLWRSEMTDGEQKMLWRGVTAGTLMGLAIGGMIVLWIAAKPEFFAAFIQ
jgi:hypothetical protein